MTLVRASYTITNTLRDAPHEQAYREEVRLVGDDRGEGGTVDLLPIDAIWDGVVGVTTSQVQFVRSPEKLYPSSVLDEDPNLIEEDEIRAVVTLTPIPPTPVTKESNLVLRGGPIIDPGMQDKTQPQK
ncbi:MAG: hypothetical protein GEU26_07010 [Nitrososphaeraceae archaeon]|nr:hypothetical protein [Nitrososphaeraceae archaeon]